MTKTDTLTPEDFVQRLLDSAIVDYAFHCMRQMLDREPVLSLQPISKAASSLRQFVRTWAEKVAPVPGASKPIADMIEVRYKLGLEIQNNLMLASVCCVRLGLSEVQCLSLLQISGLQMGGGNTMAAQGLIGMLKNHEKTKGMIEDALSS